MNENFSFNVAQLLKDVVGTSRSVDVLVDLYNLAPELSAGLAPEEVTETALAGAVRLMHTNAGILARGSFHADAVAACARCLAAVDVPLDFELEEVYSPTIDILTGKAMALEEDDRALWIDEHHILDLREVLRQDALIAMPMHVLCKDDCRGLCPTCGQNLNEGPCSCAPELDARWSALADLLKNEK